MGDWARVENGEVVYLGPIPHHWKNPDGSWVSGYDWLGEARWEADGWLRVVEMTPVVDEGTPLVVKNVKVGDGIVLRTWSVVTHDDSPLDEMEMLREKVNSLEVAVSTLQSTLKREQ